MTSRRTDATHQSRRHTKTFTGCWTCRGRKIKCDEQHPSCQQCCQKGLKCEGYNVRLYWMPPQIGAAASDDNFQLAAPKSYRSRIFQAAVPTITFNEIESIMSAIDSFQPDLLRYRDNNGPASRSFHCFGIFDANSTRSSTAGQVLLGTEKRPSPTRATRTSSHATGESQSLVATTQSEESLDNIVPIPSLNRPDPVSNTSPQLNTQVHFDSLSSGLSHAGDVVCDGSPISAPELGNDVLFYNDLSLASDPFQEAFPSHG